MPPTDTLAGFRLALFSDTYAPQINGVARTLARLVRAIIDRGGEVRVFTAADPSATRDPDVVRYASREFWAYPQLRLAWPDVRAVRDELATFQPSLVHLATEFGVGIAGRRAARALGYPIVSSYHTNFTAYAAHYHLGLLAAPGWSYLRWFHSASRRTFCPTHAVVQDLQRHAFRHCRVWSRGVDGDRFSPTHRSAELRAQLAATDDTLVVTYVGRLASEKGVDVALDAVRIAAERRPGCVRMLVVGDGPGEATLRALAPAEAHFAGRREGDALSQSYASGDVFIFPSTTDTFGNVMLEAMASGLPVLGADVGPTREVLARGGGWLCAPGDAAAFADRLVALVDDRRMLCEGRSEAIAAASTHTWDAVWNRLFADYRDALGAHEKTGGAS